MGYGGPQLGEEARQDTITIIQEKMALWTTVGAVKKNTMWVDAEYISEAVQSTLAHKLDV